MDKSLGFMVIRWFKSKGWKPATVEDNEVTPSGHACDA